MIRLSYIICILITSSFLFSCRDKIIKENEVPLQQSTYYLIDLPDTIISDSSYTFYVKLVHPIKIKKEDYFSHLILLDSMDLTLKNITKRRETPYDIQQIKTNHWRVKRSFQKKGNFTIKGGIYVNTIEFKDKGNDSLKVIENDSIFYLSKEVYIK